MHRLSDAPGPGLPGKNKVLAEGLERRRQVRGLLILAVGALVFAILRAGVHRVFTVGWWRLW